LFISGPESEIKIPRPNDTENYISLEGLTPGDAKKRVQEKLEELLFPAAKSLDLSVQCPSGGLGKKHRQAVAEIIKQYVQRDLFLVILIQDSVPEHNYWITPPPWTFLVLRRYLFLRTALRTGSSTTVFLQPRMKIYHERCCSTSNFLYSSLRCC